MTTLQKDKVRFYRLLDKWKNAKEERHKMLYAHEALSAFFDAWPQKDWNKFITDELARVSQGRVGVK